MSDKEELARLRQANISYSQEVNNLIARASSADIEITRLRDALEEIGSYTMSQFADSSHMANQCVSRACEAVYGGDRQ